MARVKFFYCHGTAYLFRWMGVPLNLALNVGGGLEIDGQEPALGTQFSVPGVNGQSFKWDGAVPRDPFPDMLDPNIFEVVRVWYPATFFPLGLSVDYGATAVIDLIDDMPAGTPFCLGGYSQGAAAMASVISELQTGSLTSRLPDFLGGVTFGNPRRKTNWRGPVGGTWSGAMDSAGSTSGGHGSFPTTGSWPRMTNPPDTWVDFTAPGDVFSSVGNSPLGLGWTTANNIALDLGQVDLLGYLTNGLAGDVLGGFNFFFLENGVSGPVNYFVDAVNSLQQYSGGGHTSYPVLPPPNADGSYSVTTTVSGGKTYLKPVGDTAYQVAIRYLNGLANEWSVTPIVVPPPAPVETGWQPTLTAVGSPTLSAGWSTTL